MTPFLFLPDPAHRRAPSIEGRESLAGSRANSISGAHPKVRVLHVMLAAQTDFIVYGMGIGLDPGS